MEFQRFTECSLIVIMVLFIGSSESYRFNVGGRNGWVLNPSENYTLWPHRHRFQVNDTLSILLPIISDATPIKDKKLLFVLGDSLFDPGNNQYLKSNFSHDGGASAYPYGMSLRNHSTSRISDGLIVPDFIALFANLSLPSPFMKPGVKFSDGASFASGGAAVLEKKNDNGVEFGISKPISKWGSKEKGVAS